MKGVDQLGQLEILSTIVNVNEPSIHLLLFEYPVYRL